jgi:hypothetical protein
LVHPPKGPGASATERGDRIVPTRITSIAFPAPGGSTSRRLWCCAAHGSFTHRPRPPSSVLARSPDDAALRRLRYRKNARRRSF